jgi:hypothetical protein
MKLLSAILLASALTPSLAAATPRHRVRAGASVRYPTLDRMLKRFSQQAEEKRIVAFAKD